MSEDQVNKKMADVYGDPISTYSRDEAIEDGFLIDFGQIGYGKFKDRQAVFTRNLIKKLEEGSDFTELYMRATSEALTHDLTQFVISGLSVFVDDNGKDLTFMLPSDY